MAHIEYYLILNLSGVRLDHKFMKLLIYLNFTKISSLMHIQVLMALIIFVILTSTASFITWGGL